MTSTPKWMPTVVLSLALERQRRDRRAGLADGGHSGEVLAHHEDGGAELVADIDLVGDRHDPRARQVDRRLRVMRIRSRHGEGTRLVEEQRIRDAGVDGQVGRAAHVRDPDTDSEVLPDFVAACNIEERAAADILRRGETGRLVVDRRVGLRRQRLRRRLRSEVHGHECLIRPLHLRARVLRGAQGHGRARGQPNQHSLHQSQCSDQCVALARDETRSS